MCWKGAYALFIKRGNKSYWSSYMPLKQGPNGTMRQYSSVNGRYVKSEISIIASNLSRKEKSEIKKNNITENLFNRARKSKDPLLFETFSYIENQLPHSIRHVNSQVYFPNSKCVHELDLIGTKFIVEVKSGTRPQCMTQYFKQKEYGDSIGKKVVLFAPNILKATKAAYINKGIIITSNYSELIKEIKE